MNFKIFICIQSFCKAKISDKRLAGFVSAAIFTIGMLVVFSAEDVDQSRIIETEKAYPKKSVIGTINYMPAVFGCVVASLVARALYDKS